MASMHHQLEGQHYAFGPLQWQLLMAYPSDFSTCSGFLGTRKPSKMNWMGMIQQINKLRWEICVDNVRTDSGDLTYCRIQPHGLSPSYTTALYKE